MPRLALDVKDTYKSVVRPVCLDVIKDIMEHTRMNRGTEIEFNSEDNHHKTEATVDFGGGDKITARASALYSESGMLTMAVFKNEHKPLFLDEELGVVLKPVYGDTRIELEIEYRCSDRQTAEQWLNGIKRRVAQWYEERLHDLSYYYIIPNPFLALIHEIHRLRENQHGYGEDLATYLSNHKDERWSTLTDQAGNNARVGIREKQLGVMGYFNFEAVPELQKGENGSKWISSFIYRFDFERIVSVTAEYPLLVHNQPLSSDYVDWNCNNNLPLERLLSSITRMSLNDIKPQMRSLQTKEGWTIPCSDTWYPDKQRRATTFIARIMLAIDSNNPRSLLNLKELGDFSFVPGVATYIEQQWDQLTYLGQSAILVTLYEDNEFYSEKLLEVNENLDVYTLADLDPRKQYHLTVSIVNDLSVLSEKAIKWLLDNGEYAQFFLASLNHKLLEDDCIPTIEINGREIMSKTVFWDAIGKIKTSHKIYHGENNTNVLTVANLMISANRSE